MKITKKIQQEIEVVSDVICNKCGQSCQPNDDVDDFYGLIEASFTTGYESKALPDGMFYSFSLCEECLAKLFNTFEIEPETKKYF